MCVHMGTTEVNAKLLFRKALIQLDYGKHDAAIENLKMALSTSCDDPVTHYGAMCCLGEVMLHRGDIHEARRLLAEVATVIRTDDVLRKEQERAKQLLRCSEKAANVNEADS